MVKKIAIFICAGNQESFASYSTKNLSKKCDIYINFFGDDKNKVKRLKKSCKYFQLQKTTKFLFIKDFYENNKSVFDQYDYIVCFDDDGIIKTGNIYHLINIAKKFNLKIISPCHDSTGKISHRIMNKYPGNHIFRYTNFIEMNFPIFKKQFLVEFLDIFDGSCCGYGIDHWYMHLLNTKQNIYNSGICDQVMVFNPYNTQINKDNINAYLSREARINQWLITKQQQQITNIKQKTLGYVHYINNQLIMTPTQLMP